MFKISSEKELLECFREIDRDDVILPEKFEIPASGALMIKDYLAWVEPSLSRVYLVFADRLGAKPLGIVFKRNQSGGGARPVMCEWCHSIRSGDNIGLLTVTKDSKTRVGLNLCKDLSCKEKVQDNPGVNDPYETLNANEKVRRILLRMAEFARHELF